MPPSSTGCRRGTDPQASRTCRSVPSWSGRRPTDTRALPSCAPSWAAPGWSAGPAGGSSRSAAGSTPATAGGRPSAARSAAETATSCSRIRLKKACSTIRGPRHRLAMFRLQAIHQHASRFGHREPTREEDRPRERDAQLPQAGQACPKVLRSTRARGARGPQTHGWIRTSTRANRTFDICCYFFKASPPVSVAQAHLGSIAIPFDLMQPIAAGRAAGWAWDAIRV